MVIERTAVQDVPALKEEQVDERAQGVITIVNEYSDTPQRLIKNTRFQSENGSIYRIRDSVEVPGKKGATPGTIEVTVFAEESGDAYNLTSGSFTIPGFAGLPQEGKIFARLQSPITGGFSGVRRTVDEADRLRARETMESQLRSELLSEIQQTNDIPNGYRAFKESVFFEFTTLPDESVESDKVRITLSGKLHAVLFAESEMAKRLAEKTIGVYDGSPIRVDNIDELSVALRPVTPEDATESVLPWSVTEYTVTVGGKTIFIWEVDVDAFASAIAGKERAVVEVPAQEGIRGAFPGIDRIYAQVRPFWKKTFPEDVADISVQVKLDE
jgi:hypothetical protein